jgi:hypothetical protein
MVSSIVNLRKKERRLLVLSEGQVRLQTFHPECFKLSTLDLQPKYSATNKDQQQ